MIVGNDQDGDDSVITAHVCSIYINTTNLSCLMKYTHTHPPTNTLPPSPLGRKLHFFVLSTYFWNFDEYTELLGSFLRSLSTICLDTQQLFVQWPRWNTSAAFHLVFIASYFDSFPQFIYTLWFHLRGKANSQWNTLNIHQFLRMFKHNWLMHTRLRKKLHNWCLLGA